MFDCLTKVNICGVDEVFMDKEISDLFVSELEVVSCAGALMGFDLGFEINSKMKQGSVMQIGFYKQEDFYFELLLMYGQNKELTLNNIKLLFNEQVFDFKNVLSKCIDLGLYWDGFYEITPKSNEDIVKMFSLIKKSFQ